MKTYGAAEVSDVDHSGDSCGRMDVSVVISACRDAFCVLIVPHISVLFGISSYRQNIHPVTDEECSHARKLRRFCDSRGAPPHGFSGCSVPRYRSPDIYEIVV